MDSMPVCLSARSKRTANLILVNISEVQSYLYTKSWSKHVCPQPWTWHFLFRAQINFLYSRLFFYHENKGGNTSETFVATRTQCHISTDTVARNYHQGAHFYLFTYIFVFDVPNEGIIMLEAKNVYTRVGTLIVATIYLQLIQNRYTSMFRSFTVLQCSHQHCVQPVASDVEVVGYL